MQKRVIVLLVLLLAVAIPTTAQESNCDIDLEKAITLLFQAQREADGGNAFGAVQTIDDVQADLLALIETCSGMMFPLPKSYIAPDQSIAFNYPEGWTLRSLDPGIYLIASTPDLVNFFEEDETIPTGEQMLFVGVLPVDEMGYDLQEITFETVAREMQEDLRESDQRVGSAQPIEINGRQAKRFQFGSSGFSGFVDIVDYLGDEEQAVVVIMALAAPGETESVEFILDAFGTSLSYPAVLSLRQPGVPLEDLAYKSVTAVTDLSEDIETRLMALAPDGSAIAWFDRAGDGAVCLFTLADQSTVCTPMPEELRLSPPLIQWSPNSDYIAFADDLYRLFRESDFILYDVAEGWIFNRTDDGFADWNFISPDDDEGPGPVWLDAVFTWGPDNQLYFIRDTFPTSTSDRDDMWTGLFRMAPDGGEPELLWDLTGMFAPFPVYPGQEFSLDGVIAVSPDASQVAVLVREQDFESPRNGIWVVDVSGENQPQHILDSSILNMGLPEDVREELQNRVLPTALAWDAEGTGIYLLANTHGMTTPNYAFAYYLEVETGQLIVLNPLTGISESDLVVVDPDTGRSPQFQMARAAVLAPDGQGLLVLNQDPISRAVGISSLRVVDGEIEQELLYAVNDAGFVPSLSATVASDGTALLWGFLFTPEQ